MHEASAAEALVKMVVEALPDPRHRVTSISLVVGTSTGYMESSLAFYFGVLSKGSLAEGAALSIRYVKPRLLCPACGDTFERERFSFDCPRCGSLGRLTKVGSEFYVDSIEVEPSQAASA
jgi:hydrogenase nickel incorporation protein HypA/HybF